MRPSSAAATDQAWPAGAELNKGGGATTSTRLIEQPGQHAQAQLRRRPEQLIGTAEEIAGGSNSLGRSGSFSGKARQSSMILVRTSSASAGDTSPRSARTTSGATRAMKPRYSAASASSFHAAWNCSILPPLASIEPRTTIESGTSASIKAVCASSTVANAAAHSPSKREAKPSALSWLRSACRRSRSDSATEKATSVHSPSHVRRSPKRRIRCVSSRIISVAVSLSE